jgi:hypothetical protein
MTQRKDKERCLPGASKGMNLLCFATLAASLRVLCGKKAFAAA